MATNNNGTTVHHIPNPNYTKLGTGSYGRTDLLGSSVSHELTKRARMNGHTAVGANEPDIQGAVQRLLGDTVVTPVLSRNLDMAQSYPRSTTGIPYSIQGTAKVLNVNVSEYLAAFKDPIKTILGTSIHREAKIIVTRKYVVGGRALITPEHAPARTVAIAEDAREVTLCRYGGDIEMNLNLFLRPSDAKEELDMKIAAQRMELERVLVEGAYTMLLSEGTNLVDAIIRSNPAYSSGNNTSMKAVRDAAERINMSTVFGAMSKHNFPVQSLMAAARYASAYSTSTQKGTVLLLPHGSMDLLQNTRRENLVYNISGPELLSRNKGKPISMQYEDAYTDPSTSVRIVIHRPFPTFQAGVANPDVGLGGLSDIVAFGSYYVLPESDTTRVQIVDFENRCWHDLGPKVGGTTAASADGQKIKLTQDFEKTALTTEGSVGGTLVGFVANSSHKQVIEKMTAAIKKCAVKFAKAVSEKKELGDLAASDEFAEFVFWKMLRGAYTNDVHTKGAAEMEKTVAKVVSDMEAGAGATRSPTMQNVLIRPQMQAVMSSGILAVPGADTGELLVGYPMTSVSTSSTEIVKIQLRVYLGSVLKKPENVLLLRNICFEGLKEGHGTRVAGLAEFAANSTPDKSKDLVVVSFPKKYMDSHCKIDYADFDIDTIMSSTAQPEDRMDMITTAIQLQHLGIVDEAGRLDALLQDEGYPTVLYKGHVRHKEGKGKWDTVHTNNGHLGCLDHPDMADRIFGTFAYNAAPNPDPR